MYQSDKYGKLKKQIDRYYLPAEITSQFILDAIKQEDKKNHSPNKIRNQTAYKLNDEARRIDFLKITGKELNSNFIAINLTTPKPRKVPITKKISVKKPLDLQEIRTILSQPLHQLIELLHRDPESYMFTNQLAELQTFSKLCKPTTTNNQMKMSIDEIFFPEHSTQLENQQRQRMERMISNNSALYHKILFLYRREKNKQKLQLSTNISPVRKSNLIDGIISRRATGTIKKFMETAYEKNLSPAELKKHYSYIKYRQFLFTINTSNRIIIYPEAQGQYKAFICKGNNGVLVKSIVKSRPWWNLRSYSDIENCALVWTQWKKTRINDQLAIRSQNIESQRNTFYINFYKKQSDNCKNEQCQQDDTSASKSNEKIGKLQTKKQQILMIHGQTNIDVLMKYVNSQQDLTSTFFTFTRRINEKKFEEISKKYVNHSIHHIREEQYFGRGKSSSTSHLKRKTNLIRIANHIPGCLQLHSKKLLFLNLKRSFEKNNRDVFDVVPETYILSSGNLEEAAYQELETSWNKNQEDKGSNKSKNVWICKPGQNSNRGHGIVVVNTLQQINNLIKSRNINPKRTLLVQKYIENPYIYQRRKFDIRCYILITCVNGYVKCYWYNDGYIRTASKEFSLKNLENKFIHLTNDAIQKKGEEYGKFQSCNKISFHDFEKYIEQQGEEPSKFKQSFIQMKQITRDLVNSCAHKLNPRHRQYCFELFGMDFMLDNKLKPYLIEANSNPCLEVDGNVLSKIIPSLIQNTIKIAIDPIFPPPYSEIPKSSRFSPANPFQTNKFQLIYDSASDCSFRDRVAEIQPEILDEEQEQQLQNNLQQ